MSGHRFKVKTERLLLSYSIEMVGVHMRKSNCSVAGTHMFQQVVRLPEQITKIEKFSFFRVLGMIQVVVPKNVEIIGDSAFYGDTALVIVELPASIKYIGSEAFQQTHLKRIYYRGNENDWKNVKIADANGVFNKATVYYYREDKPTDEGNYWHYDGEKGVMWEK